MSRNKRVWCRANLAILFLFCVTSSLCAQSDYYESDYFAKFQEAESGSPVAGEPSGEKRDMWKDHVAHESAEHHFQNHNGDDQHNGLHESGMHNGMHHERESRFKLEEFVIYPTFSYLDDLVGNYTEVEFASNLDLGRWEMENRTVLNVADLPDSINLGPTNPGDDDLPTGVRANGVGDILSGFFFSRKKPEQNHGNTNRWETHLGIGPVLTFPTATNEILGSSQFTIGPGMHFSAERGRLTTGFFLWQSWGITDDPNRKKVNQLFGKPFVIYELNKKWNFVYIPLGMSHSWDSPSGDDWTIPIGGGLRRLFQLQDEKRMGFQVQAFDYVARKPKDPQWELRFTIEFLFD